MTDIQAPTRRELLLASGVLFAWAYLPKAALASGRDPRFLLIVLRGALDGLAAVPPIGDPNWVGLRGEYALTAHSSHPVLPLDNFFGLNPAMPNFHRMFRAGHATVLHATATPYRERSHFDGQDVLESGLPKPGPANDTGWLNRALASLSPADRVAPDSRSAFAVGPTPPLVIRGTAQVLAWTPPTLPYASNDTLMRLLDLYRHTDPTLANALEERVGLAAVVGAQTLGMGEGGQKYQMNTNRVRAYFVQSAGAAAKFLSRPDGPRVGAIAFDGWDTHANEGPLDGRLATLLGALDDAMGAIESGMGSTWSETVVAVVTEFGRTARVNGTFGTDHGTATTAFLAGGALKGGRVIADWPGVGEAQLYETRDLKPTTDLRAVLKGLLRDHLHVSDAVLATTVFPGSGAVRAMSGLVT